MTYQVLARKWRPQTFETVVGQDAITRTIRNALASGRIAHAYLFAGPRGIGKTTTARLLAKALLCPQRTGPEPCGTCTVCREVTAGTAVDVLEIDGASNRGIEEIRTLRENVKYAPSRGRYKVYIIDEVHQLTEAAFNALLKTLEEPPPHIVFILATTDPRDIPPTVLSRVQRFDFHPIAPEALTATLEKILTEEKIAFEAGALPVIVRAAQGSLRDALSLLDTAIAYGDGQLQAEPVAALLGVTAPAAVRAFAAALVGHAASAALEAIDRAACEGEDLQAFARDVIEFLRRALVLKAAPAAKLADLTPAEGNELRELGESVSLDELLYVLRAFLEADALMRESPHPRVELEIAAVRATRRPKPQELEAVLKRVDEAEARLRQQALSSPAPAVQASLLAPSAPPPLRSGSDTRRPTAPAPPPSSSMSPTSAAPAASPAAAVPRAPAGAPAAPFAGDLPTGWRRVVDEVMRKKPMLGAVLAQARPTTIVDGELTIALAGNHFHREMLADRANHDIVSQAVKRNLNADRLTVAVEGESTGSPAAHPAVQAAIAEFEGEVVAVRPRAREGEGQ
jgi:DNA polymerase-3 subunit gamma/tau